jgi:hypothetical protein
LPVSRRNPKRLDSQVDVAGYMVVIATRPDTIVGFGETRIHAETATFELRASEAASPREGDQLTIGGETFVIQGEPERRDPDRLVWSLDARST